MYVLQNVGCVPVGLYALGWSDAGRSAASSSARPRSPACRAGWRRRASGRPRCARAESRPSDQSSPFSALWSRAFSSYITAFGKRPSSTTLPGPCDARPEARRPVLGVERRRVDRLLDAHVVMRPCAGRRSATTGPAARRLACRTPSTACRRAARSWATAWCAAACRGSRLFGRSGFSQNICPRVPMQKPSSGITGEDCSQPPDGVALTMLPSLVDHVEMAGVGADHAEPRHRRFAGAGRTRQQIARGSAPSRSTTRRIARHRAGPQLQRRVAPDQLAALVVVVVRQQRAQRHRARNWDRRNTPRDPRRRAWRIRPRCGRTRRRAGPSRRYRSRAAVRAVAGTPVPGSTGRTSARCGRDSRRRPGLPPSPTSAAKSSAASRPRWRRPVTSSTSVERKNLSTASATKPRYQAPRAASMRASRVVADRLAADALIGRRRAPDGRTAFRALAPCRPAGTPRRRISTPPRTACARFRSWR